jgi:hypothetical protein
MRAFQKMLRLPSGEEDRYFDLTIANAVFVYSLGAT